LPFSILFLLFPAPLLLLLLGEFLPVREDHVPLVINRLLELFFLFDVRLPLPLLLLAPLFLDVVELLLELLESHFLEQSDGDILNLLPGTRPDLFLELLDFEDKFFLLLHFDFLLILLLLQHAPPLLLLYIVYLLILLEYLLLLHLDVLLALLHLLD
jgi:hypothetical protein